MTEYFMEHGQEYVKALAEHIGISILSVFAACLIGIPLGIFCTRSKTVYRFVTTVFQTLRIIPSLAVLFLCIPILGTGILPAVIALVFLAVPLLLINTAVAFSTLPYEVIEAAQGMGMNQKEVFFKVKIPLSLPLIYTGLKSAAVEVIASGTLAAYIGAGGLGTIIFTGLSLMRNDLLLIGGGSVGILSIFVSLLLRWLEKKAMPYRFC